MKNKPLLSICIPTYNRSKQLKLSLELVINASCQYTDFVEIIVSDNCSDDNTEEVVNSFSSKNLYYFRNSSNLGFNKNLFLLTDQYANGEYCWVIGDDDYIDIDAIAHILKIIKENSNLNVLLINYRILTEDEYTTFNLMLNKNFKRVIKIEKESFSKAIDKLVTPSNILGTFMSCYIFKRIVFLNFPKEMFASNSLENFWSTFPNSFIVANSCLKKNIYYTNEALITVIPYEKSWNNILQYLNYKMIPELFRHYIEIGYNKSELRRTRKVIIYVNVIDSLSNIFRLKRITKYQFWFLLLSILYPSIYLSLLDKKLKRFL